METDSIDPSEYAAIQAEAVQVFGRSDLAEHWMHQKLLVLNVTPMTLIKTEAGRVEVRKILAAIATGGVV